MKVTIDSRSLDRAASDIQRFAVERSEEVRKIINKTAIQTVNGAKKRCPVDFGRLRASITFEPDGDGFSVIVGTDVHYAPYVEWGTGIHATHPTISGRSTPWVYEHPRYGTILTRGTRARPYLGPSWDEQRPKFHEALADAMRKR